MDIANRIKRRQEMKKASKPASKPTKRVPDQNRKTGPGTGLSVHDAVDAIRQRKKNIKGQLDQL
jgi:hypothetical protein